MAPSPFLGLPLFLSVLVGCFVAVLTVLGAFSIQIPIALVKRDWKRAFKHTAPNQVGFTIANVMVFVLVHLCVVFRSFGAVGGVDASSKATILAAAIAEAMNLSVLALPVGMIFGAVMAWRVRRQPSA